MIKNDKKRTIAVTAAALTLLESPGMTVNRLRAIRESIIQSGEAMDDLDQMYYDSVLAAIEMMTNPIFA
jgi:hypothetical protein